jgi:hypothetical protein
VIATEIPWMRKELNILKREADRWSDGTVCKESIWPTYCLPSMKRVKVFCIARCSVPTESCLLGCYDMLTGAWSGVVVKALHY